jgi:hypothetical protein
MMKRTSGRGVGVACGVVAAAGLMVGCSSIGSAAGDREAGDAVRTLTVSGVTVFNTTTRHGLEREKIIAPVGFDRLDQGWFAVLVADELALDGVAVEPDDGSGRPAIALWGLNLDTPQVGEESTPPWKWHYTNSVFWMNDREAVVALREMGFDARFASFETVTSGVDAVSAGGAFERVEVSAPGLHATVVVEGEVEEPTAVAPFERSALHWSRSPMGQGVAEAAYHGQQASRLDASVWFADRAAEGETYGAAFPAMSKPLTTSIDVMELRFQSILPADARLGLAAVELSD